MHMPKKYQTQSQILKLVTHLFLLSYFQYFESVIIKFISSWLFFNVEKLCYCFQTCNLSYIFVTSAWQFCKNQRGSHCLSLIWHHNILFIDGLVILTIKQTGLAILSNLVFISLLLTINNIKFKYVDKNEQMCEISLSCFLKLKYMYI